MVCRAWLEFVELDNDTKYYTQTHVFMYFRKYSMIIADEERETETEKAPTHREYEYLLT